MENDWAEELGSKPKLRILNSVCVNGFDGRCWKVREKNHRKVLMMLRGGTAPFQIETSRWKGVPREEKVCRECGTNEEIEDCNQSLVATVSPVRFRETTSFGKCGKKAPQFCTFN